MVLIANRDGREILPVNAQKEIECRVKRFNLDDLMEFGILNQFPPLA